MTDKTSMNNKDSTTGEMIKLRQPVTSDGPAIWNLVNDVGTLDRNSPYAYLLLCRDFAGSCVVAERQGILMGFVMGYHPPAQDNTVFVWQVGVSPQARGEGLASKMLDHLLRGEGCRGVQYLETTVTPSNAVSRRLFQSLARRLGTDLTESDGFSADLFPGGDHEEEPRLRIGPFDIAVAYSKGD